MNTAYSSKATACSLNSLRIAAFAIFIVTSALGVAGHFAFEFLDSNTFIAPFVPVNESTFEHLKLLFYPFTLCALTAYFILRGNLAKRHPSDRTQKAFTSCVFDGIGWGCISGLFAVIFLFYSINGILGFSVEWINIAVYFAGTAYACFVFYRFASASCNNSSSCMRKPCTNVPIILPIILLILLMTAFIAFTFYTPEIGLFIDPQTETYGIPKQ